MTWMRNYQFLQEFCAKKVKFTKDNKLADTKTAIFLLKVASSHNVSLINYTYRHIRKGSYVVRRPCQLSVDIGLWYVAW